MNDTIATSGISADVAEFVEAVGLELADLPTDVRAELLEDLPDHLTDVLAEGGTPRDRLGEPAAYAAELRAAAGHPARRSTRWSGDLLGRLHTADTRIGKALGYARLSDFAKSLRPAWWLLRAYLAVQLLTGAHHRTGAGALVPLVGDNLIVGLVALVAACAASIWLGRRATGRWALTASVVATVVLLFYAGLIVQDATRSGDTVYVDNSGYVDPLGGVDNVFPVGPDGKVLQGIRLYDSSGTPITVGSDCPGATADGGTAGNGTDPVTGEPVQTFPIVCPTDTDPFAPGQSPAPLPSAASSATPAPSTPAPTTPAPTTPAPTTPALTPTATPTASASR